MRNSRAEYERRGGFVRIFPSVESWRRYGSFLDPTTGVPSTASPLSALPLVGPAHNLNLLLQRNLFPEQCDVTPKPDRLSRYERALLRGHRAAFMLDGDKGTSFCCPNLTLDIEVVKPRFYEVETIEKLALRNLKFVK